MQKMLLLSIEHILCHHHLDLILYHTLFDQIVHELPYKPVFASKFDESITV